MSPNLRSIFAQVHRKSRSMGPNHSFSSTTRTSNESDETGISYGVWFLTRGLGLILGFGSAHFLFREIASEIVDKREKILKEEEKRFEERKKWMLDLAASRRKS